LEADSVVDLVERYVHAWNEPDAERRRSALAALYSDGGCIVTQRGSYAGMREVVGHVADAHDQFVGSGRFRFQSGGALGHNGCVLFRWEMVDVDSGDLADAGMNMFLLGAGGRIDGDYQFVLGVESSIGQLAVAR